MTLGPPVSPGHGVHGPSAIDRSVLGEWLAGDDTAINELLVVFRDSISADLALMRDLLARGDFEQYASAAHRLRGAALSMGARALADFTGLLFTAARAQDATACANGMRELEAHIERMMAEIPVAPAADPTARDR